MRGQFIGVARVADVMYGQFNGVANPTADISTNGQLKGYRF